MNYDVNKAKQLARKDSETDVSKNVALHLMKVCEITLSYEIAAADGNTKLLQTAGREKLQQQLPG